MGRSKENHDPWEKYKKMFGEYPPVFGYEEDEILPAIVASITLARSVYNRAIITWHSGSPILILYSIK